MVQYEANYREGCHDMDNPWEIGHFYISIRLFLALLLGGLIGVEREINNRAAGLRTHILVCMGSALIMMLSMYGFSDFASEPNVRIDPSRLAAQVISGIGFLGAGTILFNGRSITG
jgi:putative Mg2+ transporter-C (MgtC) family protein